MILPSKFLPTERSLVFIGGEALVMIKDGPRSVSEVWEGVRARHRAAGQTLAYDWFTLALTYLYAVGIVEMRDGLLSVVRRDRP